MHSGGKPPYIDPAVVGIDHPPLFGPPLLFREVTARVFPLKANIGRLTEFCDSYLNMDIPDEIVRFTPALPYVYFMVLNYGGMSATSLAAQRTGWVSQREVFFLVPLQRWRRENDKLAFKGWASSTPFIFVDDPMSQTTGREVYGWPKVQAWIDSDESLWTKHPRAPTRLFTMETDIFAQVFAGERDRRRELVTVERDTVASWAEFPVNWKCPWSPTSVWPNWITGSLSLMSEAADIAAGLRLRGYPGRDLGALLAMGREALSYGGAALNGLWPDALGRLIGATPRGDDPYLLKNLPARNDAPKFFTNSINLKQFRNPERPELACYTALIDSAMGVDRVNAIGLLGDWDLLRGDPSGGFTVGVRHYQAQPIIDTLGIEAPAAFVRAAEGDLIKLRPTFPFWMDVDLLYGAGRVICSYERDGWTDATGATVRDAKAPPPRAKAIKSSASGGGFNTALGAATQPVIGPFNFPDVTLQVYPLLADAKKLARLVDGAWNRLFPSGSPDGPPPAMRLEPMGSYIYMIVSATGDHFGTMYSGADNIGWWADREIAFCLPVRWYRDGQLYSVALIEPFVYANKARAVVTDREVNGRNSFVASIDSAEDVWMKPGGPSAPRRLVHVGTETYIALNQGQRAAQLTLLEVDERDAMKSVAVEGWRGVAEDWGHRIAEELKRKTAIWQRDPANIEIGESLALETLARFAPFNRLTLKQYRDAEHMDLACYQEVVHTERAITHIHEIREMEKPVHVWLHRLPNHPLAEALGLQIKTTHSDRNGVVDCLQPIRPFWMRVAVREELGRIVHTSKPLAPPADARPGRPNRRPRMKAPPAQEHGYFVAPGPSGIVPHWPQRIQIADRRGLSEKVDVWLQDGLSNELAWRRLKLAARPDFKDLRAAALKDAADRASLAADLDAFFARARVPGADFSAFLRTLPTDRKSELVEALRRQFDAPPERDVARSARSAALAHLAEAGLAMEKLSPAAQLVLREILTKDPNAGMEPQQVPARLDALAAAYAPGLDRASSDTLAWFRRGGASNDELQKLAKALRAPIDKLASADPAPTGRTARAPAGPAPSGQGGLFERLRLLERWILCPPGVGETPWDSLIPDPAVEAIDNIRAKRFLADFDLDEEERALVETTFDLAAEEALGRLLAHAKGATSFHLLQRSYESAVLHGQTPALDPTEALVLVSDRFGACIEDWRLPHRWRRLLRKQAADVVTSLDEVQLVVEAILDHGWESTSSAPPPCKASVLRAPGMPASSVGPFVGDSHSDWAARHGLRHAADGERGERFFIADDHDDDASEV